MDKKTSVLLEEIISKVKHINKSLAANDEALYSISLESLLLLTQLKERMDITMTGQNLLDYSKSEVDEINKVKRKLPKWKKKPDQYNAKILDAFFHLRTQERNISKEMLEKYCSDTYGKAFPFSKNFPQMHNIASKNHAKIFETSRNGDVHLWEPVAEYIEEVWSE